jgi:hypothetical protein
MTAGAYQARPLSASCVVRCAKPVDDYDRLVADVREHYAGMGVDPTPSSPDRAAAYLKSETDKYAKVVKAIGLRIE